MKDRFHQCLNTCKALDCAALVSSSTERAIENISADKLLYNYAIEMCQSAALEELFGRPTEVCAVYTLFTLKIYLRKSLTCFLIAI
jgi:serine/threonine-protein kinase ULK/ATG1